MAGGTRGGQGEEAERGEPGLGQGGGGRREWKVSAPTAVPSKADKQWPVSCSESKMLNMFPLYH